MADSKVGIYGELWKDIEGYSGLYEVSNLARVRNAKNLHILKVHLHRPRNGYFQVALFRLERTPKLKTHLIHRLVASAFLGPCPDGYEVDHIDDTKTNNVPTNLQYLTHVENCKKASEAIARGVNFYLPVITERPLHAFNIEDPDIEDLLRLVAIRYGLRVAQFDDPGRWQPLAVARQIVCYIAKVDLHMTHVSIARRLNRDHSTSVHAVKLITERIGMYEDIATVVSDLRVVLGFQDVTAPHLRLQGAPADLPNP